MDALRVGSSDSVGVLVPLRRNEQGRGEHQIEGGEATSNHEKNQGKSSLEAANFFFGHDARDQSWGRWGVPPSALQFEGKRRGELRERVEEDNALEWCLNMEEKKRGRRRHGEHRGCDFSRAVRAWTEGEAGMAMGLPRNGVALEDCRAVER